MHETGWHSHIFGHAATAREADFIVASFTEVCQSIAAVAADATGKETLHHHLIARHESTHALTNGCNFASPFMTVNNGVAIKACRPGALVKFHVTAADANSARSDQYIFRPDGGNVH